MAEKTAAVYARVEPEIKEQAESILSQLGMTASGAISLFYNQIIMQRGLPFEVKLPRESMVRMDRLTEEEFNRELEKGYNDLKAGRSKPAKQAFAEVREACGL